MQSQRGGVARCGRRRGDVLESAILDAAWAELNGSGWAGFSMDAVARRAGAGKASLYKRWPTRVDLALAAARERAARSEYEMTPGGDLRSSLLAILQRTADFVAGPFGEVIRGLVGDVRRDGTPVAYRLGSEGAAVGMVSDALAGAGLFEVHDAASQAALRVGLELVVYDYLLNGSRPTNARLVEVLDGVWLPALAPYVGVGTPDVQAEVGTAAGADCGCAR